MRRFLSAKLLRAAWAAPNLMRRLSDRRRRRRRQRTRRLVMGTADNAMGGSYGAREFGPRDWAGARWRRSGSRWTAFEIIAMVLGFIVFWPIGLAILGYKFWQGRYGGPDLQTLATNKWQDARTMMASNSSWSSSWACGGAIEAREPLLRLLDRQRRVRRVADGRARPARRRAPQARRRAARVRRICGCDPPRQGPRGVRAVHGRAPRPPRRRRSQLRS